MIISYIWNQFWAITENVISKIHLVPGVYAEWSKCYDQVIGFKKTSYKKFKTEKEAILAFESTMIGEDQGPSQHMIIPENDQKRSKEIVSMYWKDVLIIIQLFVIVFLLISMMKA